jgi:hypothetical protein
MKPGQDPFAAGFDYGAVVQFARIGIYPPPYAGDERNPETVLLLLASQERWRDPPSLVGTDEEGVELQREAFEKMVAEGLSTYHDRDPSEFGSWHR